jgi:hypothetical protein
MPKLFLPLIAALAVGGAATAGGVYLATRDAGVEEVTRPPSVLDTPEPSPTVAGAETPTAGVTPTADTADWDTYVDSALGLSVNYPPDLVAKDITPGGLTQLAIEFRSQESPSRGFTVSVTVNEKGLTLDEWAVEYAACQPKGVHQAILGGTPGIACTREVIEGVLEPALLAQRSGKIFLISATGLTDSEFAQIAEAFRF